VKLIVATLVMKFSGVYYPIGLLPCSHELFTELVAETDISVNVLKPASTVSTLIFFFFIGTTTSF
jgi:hypothetical protein